MVLLLCSHSHNDVPPKAQRNISMAAVRGAMHLSIIGRCVDEDDVLYFAQGINLIKVYA